MAHATWLFWPVTGPSGDTVLIASIVAVFLTGMTAVPASAALAVTYSAIPALPTYLTDHDGPPPGANDWSCRPSGAHPRPVILVPATLATMALDFNAISPLLKNTGYCVFALNYGRYGLLDAVGDIPASAAEFAAFADQVRAATGARQVDVVGHSQGGMLPRYYLRFLRGAGKIHTLVGLSPSNHGTTIHGVTGILGAFPWLQSPAGMLAGPAWLQQAAGSPFMTRLNAGGDTVPGVHYTVIETRYDEVVTPYTSAFLTGDNTTNITLQDQCASDLSEHLAIAFDHIALRDVLNALDPDHAAPPACSAVLPFIGG